MDFVLMTRRRRRRRRLFDDQEESEQHKSQMKSNNNENLPLAFVTAQVLVPRLNQLILSNVIGIMNKAEILSHHRSQIFQDQC